MKLAAVFFLLAQAATAAQLIDLDTEAVEIRTQTVISITDQNSVRVDLCPSLTVMPPAECTQQNVLQAVLPWADFDKRLQWYFLLPPQEGAGPNRLQQEAVVDSTRAAFRAELAAENAEAAVKDKLETILNALVFALEEGPRTEALVARRKHYANAVEILGKDRHPLVVRETAPQVYEGLLAPFEAYLERNRCRCENTLQDGAIPIARCVLRKGGRVLAWADSNSHDCDTRSQCRARAWYGQEALTVKVSFQPLVDKECGGYFTAGNRALRTVP